MVNIIYEHNYCKKVGYGWIECFRGKYLDDISNRIIETYSSFLVKGD